MIFVNEATGAEALPREIAETFLRLLSPFAPHIAEELWQRLGHDDLIYHADWPTWRDDLVVEDTITLVVQVNGKKRDELTAPRDASREELERIALESERVQRFTEGKPVRKVIVVPGRLVNVVV